MQMLFRAAELAAIQAGTADLAFRRWASPRVKVGTKLRTRIGLVEVLEVDVVDEAAIDEAAAQRAGTPLPKLRSFLARQPERPIYRVELRFAGEDPRIALRGSADLSDEERVQLISRLDSFDRRSSRGAWTRETLRLIAEQPETLAATLAEQQGVEKLVFKRDVRKLKELGLTESMPVGYRLSPRGRTLLDG